MARTQRRTYRMTLSQFQRYVRDKLRELEKCYQEVEEVRQQFDEIFKREMQAWQEVFAYCYPRVAAQRHELPAPFPEIFARTEKEERLRLQKEIADLKGEIQKGQSQMDELMAQAQSTIEELRKANPELNEREERLKALMVKYQDEYAQAFEEIERLKKGFLGSLKHMGRIHHLRKLQRMVKEKQKETLAKLRQVRREWLDKVEEAGETQAELRKQWQEIGVHVAQAKARLRHLENNFDALVEQATLQRVLEELEDPPPVPGELGEKLQELAQRNQTRRAYEEGLEAVAEAAGILKGIKESLERFYKSVSTVVQEQRRYSLPEVYLTIPRSVAILNTTWQELGKEVQDEKRMGAKPREFSRIARKYIRERLTDGKIKDYFESMGKALNRATSAWG